jgi:hypothetical protein
MPFPPHPRIPFMQHRPEFPSVSDLPQLSPADAERVLAALRVLVENDLMDVYSSSGSNDTRWNVWSNIRWCRIPLQQWAAEWLATQEPEGSVIVQSPISKEAR